MKFHPYKNTDPFKVPEAADKLMNEYSDIADSLGIQTFLLYGACLGLVRDGSPFIEGDNDIDVGIFGDFEKFKTELVKNGFICERVWKINAHFLRYNILFDVFFTFHEQRFLQFYQKLDTVTYKGRNYNVPHPVEDYLEARYGDWRVVRHRKVWEG